MESARCSSVTHIDFYGADLLPSNPPAVATAAACCAKCRGHDGCVAFSYMLDTGTCYLKSGVRPRGNADRLSAWVNASCACDGATPEPPATCWDQPHPCTPGLTCDGKGIAMSLG